MSRYKVKLSEMPQWYKDEHNNYLDGLLEEERSIYRSQYADESWLEEGRVERCQWVYKSLMEFISYGEELGLPDDVKNRVEEWITEGISLVDLIKRLKM